MQFNFLWLYPFQKGFYIEFKHSTLSLILENQTANQTCTHSHIFWSQTKSLRLPYLGRENQRKRAFLDFQLGVVPGFVIALISPWVTLVPSIRQTFPFWMPKEKLLFDNGTLESDEKTIWLCPAQSNRTAWWFRAEILSLEYPRRNQGTLKLISSKLSLP